MTWSVLFYVLYAHSVVEGSTLEKERQPAPEPLTDSIMGCEEGWYSFNRKCYKHRGRDYSTWEKASEYCRDEGGSLVVIENEETQDFVRWMSLEEHLRIWIGLNDQQEEGSYIWVDGTTVNYTNWQNGEPSGLNYGDEDCVEMVLVNDKDTGNWNDAFCTHRRSCVCQKDQTEQSNRKAPLDPRVCSEKNNSGFKFRNSCYYLVKEKRNWKEAEAYCSSQYSGHLVAVRSSTVYLILDYVLKGFIREIWIGLSLKAGFKQKWSNGFFVGYDGWGSSKRDFTEGLCATLKGGRRWSTAACNRKLAFICEQTTDKPVVRTETTNDYVCPSEPNDWKDLGGDVCYFFELEKTVSWYEANFLCKLRGGKLVSLHSKPESDAVHELVIHTQDELHIGLHLSLGKKGFGWSDKRQLSWTYWSASAGDDVNEECGSIWTFYMSWNRNKCSAKRGYICSARKIAPQLNTLTNITRVEESSEKQHPDIISYTTFVAVLGCTTFALFMLGIMVVYYLNPCLKKKSKKNAVRSTQKTQR